MNENKDRINGINEDTDSHNMSVENKDDMTSVSEGCECNDIRNSEEREESEKDNGGISEEKGKTDEVEEEGSDRKEEVASEKEKNLGEEAGDNRGQAEVKESGASYSSAYVPPYYVPNFSSVQSDEQTRIVKKKCRRYGLGALVLIAAISATVALIGGFLGGVFAVALAKDYNSSSEATIIQNDGTIKVNKEVGSTGYSDLTYAQVAALVSDTVVDVIAANSGSGSGVIISQAGNRGYIVTNYHVIDGAAEISARLSDGEVYTAHLVGGSESEDLAVLYIDVKSGKELSCAVGGHVEDLRAGDEVVAIGNPLGHLSGTVTNGIISSTNRTVTIEGNTMRLIQTNAEVNPGNSGGGLFNMAGELIGIVNSKVDDEEHEGLGFAIPYDDQTVEYIANIIEHGYIKGKPSLNIKVDTWYGKSGIYVVSENSDIFEVGDKIVSINSNDIESKSDFNAALNSLEIGSVAEVIISRDGKLWKAQVTVTEETSA